MSMMKFVALLLFIIASTSALRQPTRHIIHHQVFLRRSVERQSSCDSIIADCTNRSISLAEQYNLTTTEGLHRYLSAVAVLQCESCFGDLESYYRCTGDNYYLLLLNFNDTVKAEVGP